MRGLRKEIIYLMKDLLNKKVIVVFFCFLVLFLEMFPQKVIGNSRVVKVYSPESVKLFTPQTSVVQSMIEAGLKSLFFKETATEALLSIVSPQDVVGIKVYSLTGAATGSRREVVLALVHFLKQAGVPDSNIIVWDRSLDILRQAGYLEISKEFGFQVAGSVDEGFDKEVSYSSFFPSTLVAGDVEFPLEKRMNQSVLSDEELVKIPENHSEEQIGRRSFISTLLTKKLTKIILVTPLNHHNQLGVSGHIYSLASGSTDNFLRFESDGFRLSEAVAEVYAMEEVGDKVVLCITDALVAQYRGQSEGLLHYSKSLETLYFSKDPVALDWLSLKLMMRLRSSADRRSLSLSIFSPAGATLCENASLLELGYADDSKIDLVEINFPRERKVVSFDTAKSQKNKKKPWYKFW